MTLSAEINKALAQFKAKLHTAVKLDTEFSFEMGTEKRVQEAWLQADEAERTLRVLLQSKG